MLLVNIRAQKELERKKKERLEKEQLSKIQATTGPPARPRKRKGLNFVEQGTYVEQAKQLKKRARLEELKKRVDATAAETGIANAVRLATLTTQVASISENKKTTATSSDVKDVVCKEEEEVPDIEWWDKILLRNRPLEEVVLRANTAKPEDLFEGITNLIERPPIKKPPGPDNSNVEMPIFLTQKEKKKLRRQNRKNLELEKQEQMKLGLLPKPEPKLKRSNIMHALGNEAIINPSMAEQMVREQEEKRLQAHLEHNEAKKLTLEEKRAKKLRKVREDLSVTGVWVSVFRILNMNSQANKFKISQNAKQLTMSGVLVLFEDLNLVVVEGGPKQQRKYKHLMMDRIQWSDDPIIDPADPEKPPRANKCLLVWEGQVINRSFRGFKVKPMNSEKDVREFFKQAKVEHYWDLAFKMTILDSIEEP